MTAPNEHPLESVQIAGIERKLGNRQFQRIFAWSSAVTALVYLLVYWTAAFDPAARTSATLPQLWSSPVMLMGMLLQSMHLLLLVTSLLLSFYILWRDSPRPLVRHLVCLASAIALIFAFILPIESSTIFRNSIFFNGKAGHGWYVAFSVCLMLLSALMVLVSGIKFILYFPKPITMMGFDQDLYSKAIGQNWRDVGFWFGKRGLKQHTSLQGICFLTGLLLIALVCFQANVGFLKYAGFFLMCWQPFAIIGAKIHHVHEQDQRAVRWVAVGQSAWLAFTFFSLLLVFVARASNLLVFANSVESNAFTGAFFGFFFLGFLFVLLATLAFAIFYQGTLDPDLIIRRTWVIAIVSTLSGLLFVVLERVAAAWFSTWLNISSDLAFIIVGAVTAACVFPLRKVAERSIKGAIQAWHSTYALADGVREEAVIVFADLSGYTALTEKNEREALILAAIFHRDAERVAKAHRGRLIKTIGDEVMLRFETAEEAYHAIKQLVREYFDHATPLVSAPLAIHAALHSGEVVLGNKGDVYGATVNLAARLLGLAGSHDVVASEAVVAALSAIPRSTAKALGAHQFKNVQHAVECFLLMTTVDQELTL
ncbi:MAG: adenylate/guanylate cyclase domain-containing protein [Burkholderiaceae bacterium]|nr:adenylate/guanylate cyclase domain-containing protein [Burkholderiaceae bacterium]